MTSQILLVGGVGLDELFNVVVVGVIGFVGASNGELALERDVLKLSNLKLPVSNTSKIASGHREEHRSHILAA